MKKQKNQVARKYLKNLEKYKNMIDLKTNQLKELERYANLIGCNNISNVFCKTTSIKQKTEDFATKKIDLTEEVKMDIAEYTFAKNDIINTIYKINDNRYINLLLKRYCEFKKLEKIALEMDYDYNTIRHMHNRALQKLENILNEHTKTQKNDV